MKKYNNKSILYQKHSKNPSFPLRLSSTNKQVFHEFPQKYLYELKERFVIIPRISKEISTRNDLNHTASFFQT